MGHKEDGLSTTELLTVFAGVATGIAGARGLRRFTQRVVTADDISLRMVQRKRRLSGRVVHVGDGDNFRLYHQPALRRWENIPEKIKISEQSIHVRLAGVDAPECAHFGQPGQPYGEEARQWLREYLTGKRVMIKVLGKDQYRRVVAMAWVREFPFLRRKNVSVELLRQGLGVVYDSAGAQYDGLLPLLRREEARARTNKVRMWKQSKTVETPMAFKKRQRDAEASTNANKSVGTLPKSSKPSAPKGLRALARTFSGLWESRRA